MPECFPARILRFFFGLAPMAKNRSSQICASAAMTLNQLAKRISIALFRQANKLVVCQLGYVIENSVHSLPLLSRVLLQVLGRTFALVWPRIGPEVSPLFAQLRHQCEPFRPHLAGPCGTGARLIGPGGPMGPGQACMCMIF
jgi:hypothetical protein